MQLDPSGRIVGANEAFRRISGPGANPGVEFLALFDRDDREDVRRSLEGDSRVHPMQARKMCAAMQTATSGARPILLRRETEAGHAGKSISRTVDDQTDTFAFLFAELGVA